MKKQPVLSKSQKRLRIVFNFYCALANLRIEKDVEEMLSNLGLHEM